jgi:RNA polymerase sigma-70 factor, ECF subfamily
MYRLALRMGGKDCGTDAEDLVQESWARAFDRLHAFAGKSALSTWLCGITANVAREHLSRSRLWHTEVLHEDDHPAVSPPPGGLMDVERAVAMLPAAARSVFLLHDVEGFTHAEIAEHFGWHEGTSKTLLFRARRALRARLGAPDD